MECDRSDYGSLRIEYANYSEQYNGQYSRQISIPQFDFTVEKSLQISKIKSPEHIQNELVISGQGGFDSVAIKIHYLKSGFDTTCMIYDAINVIPMRKFSDYESRKIKIFFNFPNFDFSPTEVNYDVTGIAIGPAKPIDIVYFCHFSTSEGDSIIVHSADHSGESQKDYYDTFSTD